MYYGCDSNTGQACTNSSGKQQNLDFYIGELGFGTDVGKSPCGSGAAFNSTAATNATYSYGYWFLMGPESDPNYDGTTTQAYNWGISQGKAAVSAWLNNSHVGQETIYADIETYVPSSCSGTVAANMGWLTGQTTTDYDLNQHVWIGFKYQVVNNSIGATLSAGVYSSPYLWGLLMNNFDLTGHSVWTSETSLTSNVCPTSMSQAKNFGNGTLDFWQYTIKGGDYDVGQNMPN